MLWLAAMAALKIMTPGSSGKRNYAAQSMIASTVQDTPHLLMYQETFVLFSAPETHHKVLVIPLLGPSR